MKAFLESLHIQYTDSEKYYTECPSCSHGRKKQKSRTLLVSKDNQFLRFKCLHEGQCSWNKTQKYDLEKFNPYAVIDSETSFTHFPKDFSHPLLEGKTYYTYKDVDGNTQCYIVRVDATADQNKYFYPLAMSSDLEVYQKLPPFKFLYNADLLDPTKKRTVLVVEGEKAAEAAKTIFTQADVVTWVGGTGSVNKGNWELLKDRVVYFWPDNDMVGRKAMHSISEMIESDHMYWIDTSELKAGQDLADNIDKEIIKKLWQQAKKISQKSPLHSITVSEFFEKLARVETGLSLGWADIDTEVRLPQSGLVTILGRTSHGKSTLLLNMALQHMKQTERPLVYYSYEVPTERMLLKAMMILEGIQYSKIPHENETMYRTKLLNGQLPQWDYIKGILNNRLFLTDSNDEIETIYQSLDRPKFDGALIYLDYLQLIPIDGRNARYEKLQKISNTLRELANKRNMVIMTGSQIVDGETPLQDQAREAKDIEQASELVLRVWNKTVAEARGAYKIVKDKETKEDEIKHYYDEVDGDFVVHVLKNRNGEPGKKFGFNLKQGVKLDLVTAESTKNKLSF